MGTGFGKRVPEMSLINSLRRREQGMEKWRRRNVGEVAREERTETEGGCIMTEIWRR